MLSAMHGTSVQQRQYVIAGRIQPDLKYTVLYDSMYEYVRVCTSIYAYVRVCASMYQYNQGFQIFMVCTYLFVIFGSNIIWNPDEVYSRYIPCIYHVYSERRYIPGISQVYTMDIEILFSWIDGQVNAVIQSND